MIGWGVYGVVFDIGRGRVLKITNSNVGNQNPIINKNIEGVAKIFSSGLIKVPKQFTYINKYKREILEFPKTIIRLSGGEVGYIIMEKLTTKQVKEELNDLEIIIRYFISDFEIMDKYSITDSVAPSRYKQT